MSKRTDLLAVVALVAGSMGCATAGAPASRPLGFAKYAPSIVCPTVPATYESTRMSRLTVLVTESLGNAVPDASVTLRDGSGEPLVGLSTDENGLVRVQRFRSGRYSLLVEFVGFLPVVVPELELAAGCLTSVTVPLQVAEVTEFLT